MSKKRQPVYKRYPADECMREQSSDEEERYVRQRFEPIVEEEGLAPVTMAMPVLDFDALDDDNAAAAPAPAPPSGELSTAFLRYIVYTCAFDTPVHMLAPPQPGVDSDELCRDKLFAANAARDAARFKRDELAPHVERLKARMTDACAALGDQVERFHRVMQTTPKMKRLESAIAVADIKLTDLPDEAFADLLQCVHVVYHFEKYVRYAVCDALRALPDDMSFFDTWTALTGPRAAALPLPQWDGASSAETSFVRECCHLRDVFTTTQSWM